MSGKREIERLKRRIEATFERVEDLESNRPELELRSDFARYLCVLVSGYVESAVSAMTTCHCRRLSSPTVSSFASRQLARPMNMKAERLLALVGSFNLTWRHELESYLEGSKKESLDSVVNLRNGIAHGDSVGVTYVRIKNYYQEILSVVEFLEERFLENGD